MPDSVSTSFGLARRQLLTFAPPSAGWPPAIRRCPCAPTRAVSRSPRHDVAWWRSPGRRSGRTATTPRPGPRRPDPELGGVVDMHQRALHPAAAHQQRRVVHPRVLRTRLTHADHPQRIAVGLVAPRQVGDLGGDVVVGQTNPRLAVDHRLARGTAVRMRARRRRRADAAWSGDRSVSPPRRSPNRSPPSREPDRCHRSCPWV